MKLPLFALAFALACTLVALSGTPVAAADRAQQSAGMVYFTGFSLQCGPLGRQT